MRILITNDDGITAPGLAAAQDIARELSGPDGEIWTVAPASEQSGVSHCISYVRPMRVVPMGERIFAIDGSPADCVIAALGEIMTDGRPDLILSGVNRGHNVAEDTVYSGTIGGAMEGTLNGIRSIALSQYYGRDMPQDPFAAARATGARVLRAALDADIWTSDGYEVFLNVNFPATSGDGVRGVRATSQGQRKNPPFGVEPHQAPNGRSYLWLTHGMGNHETAPGTDSRECHDGYVTVTPLRADLTAGDKLPALTQALGQI